MDDACMTMERRGAAEEEGLRAGTAAAAGKKEEEGELGQGGGTQAPAQ